jgi:hypothetical protein
MVSKFIHSIYSSFLSIMSFLLTTLPPYREKGFKKRKRKKVPAPGPKATSNYHDTNLIRYRGQAPRPPGRRLRRLFFSFGEKGFRGEGEGNECENSLPGFKNHELGIHNSSGFINSGSPFLAIYFIYCSRF